MASKKSMEMAADWKTQIKQCEEEYKRYYERCKNISQKYRDERLTIDDERKSLNLFWSNVQTLKPAIYSKVPVPICERRFLDKDTVGRVAATILERGLRYEVSMSGFDCAIRRARNDYLLTGRGQVWIRYYPQFGDPISPESTANDDMKNDETGEPLEEAREEREDVVEHEILSESLCVDYIHWQDFYQLPAKVRTEEEIQGKARRIYMSRDDLVERFGKRIGKKVPLDHVPESVPDEGSKGLVQGKTGMQATVYEIWWKPTRRVYFIAKEYEYLLEETDDPLGLEGFFPCPPALISTTTNDTMIPVPDYVEAQDQYVQIDHLTKRIDVLTNALKVVGVYDSSAQGLKRVFEEAKEPDLIPVESWAMFAEKGGLKGAIDWVPLDMVAKTLQILIEVRTQVMQDLDHVTGITDISRGTSDARETLGGVRLKQNNTTGRLGERQDDMARFCRDIIGIMGEIISVHFDPKTLIQVSGALYDEGLDPPPLAPAMANQLPPTMLGHNGGPPMGVPPTPTAPPSGMPAPQVGAPSPPPAGQPSPQAPPSLQMPPETPEQKMQRKEELITQALELLRQEKLRGFRIDIETDSTVQGDVEQEKSQRIEFVEGVTKFIETAAQVTMGAPEFAPLAAKMLQFAVRGFRVGRDLESAIEEFSEKVELDAKAAAANPQAKPNPEAIKAQAERDKSAAAIKQVEIQGQLDLAQQKQDAQNDQVKAQFEQQKMQMELQMKAMEIEIAKIKAQADMAKVQHDQHKMDTERSAGDADLSHKVMTAQNHHAELVANSIQPFHEALQNIGNQLGQHAQHLQAIHEHNNSPVEFMRGKDGKLAGVRRGNRAMTVQRDGQGKAMRLS